MNKYQGQSRRKLPIKTVYIIIIKKQVGTKTQYELYKKEMGFFSLIQTPNRNEWEYAALGL